MNRHKQAYATIAIVLLIVIIAAFGMYVPYANMAGHDAGCPFSFGGTALCAQPLAHLSHWQNAFAATLTQLLALFSLVLATLAAAYFISGTILHTFGVRRIVGPPRPALFQVLFSRGILNRRAP